MAVSTADNVKKFTSKQLRRFSRMGFDWNMVLILIFLLGFGLIMVYSASSYVAARDHMGNQKYFLSRQAIADLIGIVGAVALMFVPHRLYNKVWFFPILFYGIAFLLPFLTIPFGISSHGASRWIEIPGTGFNLQPAEVSKLTMILFMAWWLNKYKNNINTWKYFGISMALPLPVCGVIYIVTDNLSSAIIIFAISFIMVFVVSRDYLKTLAVVGVVGIIAIIVIAYVQNTDISESGFRLARIYSWLHPENSSDTTAHQTIQSLYAIGNGGVWGRGLGQSIQKISNLPEPHNDMIFSVICEELGIVGAITLIIMFILLLSRMFFIARDTRDTYAFLLVVGVMAHITVQVVLNIAVATNSLPNTGVSLPFISYGGSSVCFLMADMGVVFEINRSNRAEVRK
ncbi:MAG: FtsW/RodA/SpoVE family cell cycle protein [Lachnospiraceae bacterium]|nr:FtsW/RodA/SpoVE family cell cycle protein [Lachnospiraceae bacterium]